MIGYLGSINKIDNFNGNINIVQNVSDNIDSIGFWLTSDINSSKPFAIGTEKIFKKSNTEFWDDGEPKVVQVEHPVQGFIYKIYIDEPILKNYGSTTEDSYNLFMIERDEYCDYFSAKKRNLTWKDDAILLNKEEANTAFRNTLVRQGYDGFLLPNCKLQSGVTDFFCMFSNENFHIADIIPIDDLDK